MAAPVSHHIASKHHTPPEGSSPSSVLYSFAQAKVCCLMSSSTAGLRRWRPWGSMMLYCSTRLPSSAVISAHFLLCRFCSLGRAASHKQANKKGTLEHP